MNTNRSLTFFIDDVEQSNYVVNIPDAVRFWVFLSRLFFINHFLFAISVSFTGLVHLSKYSNSNKFLHHQLNILNLKHGNGVKNGIEIYMKKKRKLIFNQ